MREPLDPFSLVLDERRHWDPEWYSWLKEISTGINDLRAMITANTAAISVNTAAISANTTAISVNTAAITTLEATSPPGLIFISSQNIASAVSSVAFTGLDNTTYEHYVFHFSVKPSVTDNGLNIRFSTNNGSSYVSSGVYWYTWVYGTTYVAGPNLSQATTATLIQISGGRLDHYSQGVMHFWPSTGASYNVVDCSTNYLNSSGLVNAHLGGLQANTNSAVVNAIQFFMSTGNITSGRITLYGMRKT